MQGKGLGTDSHIYRAVYVLSILAVTVILMAALCIGLPLFLDARRAKQRGEHLPRGMRPFYLFFAAIGLAFLLVEVSQLQRLSVFLGHPVYSLAVCLFTVLVFSGIGSFLTQRFVDVERPATVMAPFGVLLVLLLAFGLVAPALTHAMDGQTTPVRVLVAVAMLAPIALFMGMPFSIGMGLANRHRGAPVAYFWGINGACSVVASVLGATIALFFGITASFATGALAVRAGDRCGGVGPAPTGDGGWRDARPPHGSHAGGRRPGRAGGPGRLTADRRRPTSGPAGGRRSGGTVPAPVRAGGSGPWREHVGSSGSRARRCCCRSSCRVASGVMCRSWRRTTWPGAGSAPPAVRWPGGT